MTYTSDLSTMIYNKQELTNEQKESLFSLVSSGTRQKMRDKLRHAIYNVPLQYWQPAGIYHRVHLEHDGEFAYCAGQDYTSEIRTVRQCIAGLI